MDEQATGSVALGLVVLIMLALLAIALLPRGGAGALLFAAVTVLATVVALVIAAEGRQR